MATETEITSFFETPCLTGTPPLVAGDRLSADEFLRRHEAMPELKKAELIDGVVYLMASPVSVVHHGAPHADLIGWLTVYRAYTPLVEVADNSTVRFDRRNVPQPDAYLRVVPTAGGQSSYDGAYAAGPPEFVAEVSASSASYDLHDKKQVFLAAGVREYVVWRTEDRVLDWFIRRGAAYDPLTEDGEGLLRSDTFPGLWLDGRALLAGDMRRVLEVAMQGIASPEHAAFCERLRLAAGG
ncbi:MAG: Uma2 family endonuclease [Lacipirellulaceae bacterium]